MTNKKGQLVSMYVYVVILIIAAGAVILIYSQAPVSDSQLKSFESCTQISEFITNAEDSGMGYGFFGAAGTERVEAQAISTTADTSGPSKLGTSEAISSDYSTTNIQIQGVDEADIIKNDGKYIYAISQNTIFIVDAYPTENAQVLSKLEFSEGVHEMFINKDRLIVFAHEYGPVFYGGMIEPMPFGIVEEAEITTSSDSEVVEENVAAKEMSIMPRWQPPKTYVYVYDVSDRTNPILERNMSIDGSYYDSRMIGDHVYAVIDNPVQRDNITIPRIMTAGVSRPACDCGELLYFDIPDYSYKFTTILAVNTQTNDEPDTKVFLMGYTQNMFVSMNNIYVTYMKRITETDMTDRIIKEIIPELPSAIASEVKAIMDSDMKDYQKMNKLSEIFNKLVNDLSDEERAALEKVLQEKMEQVQKQIAKEMERTIIHKISINNGNINYIGQGEAPGNVLNQFSMDEHNGYFRIATTTGRMWGSDESLNHVYILNNDLNIVGSVEDLASGEKIYSARFIGDRAYMVTFRQIDPLFVIDLSNPTAPQVLGYLKVTGYSDYLHPYDENHIIGIGKETIADEERDLAWQQGVKISLFDVSDVANPKEISKFEIGDRGTESEALRDHKAFLFDKEKNLLVLPITLAEIDENQYVDERPEWAYGKQVWQGAYVFDITLENGIRFKNRITHHENITKSEYGYTNLPYQYKIRRSLYMDDVLYTISQKIIKANDLNTIEEIKKIELE